MANPVLLLIKPLVKAIGKEALKILGKEAGKATASAGLKAVAKGTFEAIDAVNIARAAVDKKILGTVAKTLGMSTKELTALTKALNMTKARKAAVKGKNFIENVNRFSDTKNKNINDYKKKLVEDTIKNKKDREDTKDKDFVKQRAVFNALKLLEGKLKKIDPTIELSDLIWENIPNIDIADVYQALTYVEMDLYGDSGQQETETIFLDETHKGYRQGMEQIEFMAMMEDMLLQGFHSTPIDAIY